MGWLGWPGSRYWWPWEKSSTVDQLLLSGTQPYPTGVAKIKSPHLVMKLYSKALLSAFWAQGCVRLSFPRRRRQLLQQRSLDVEIIKPSWAWAGVWKCSPCPLSSTDSVAEGGFCVHLFDGEWLWLLGFAPKPGLSLWQDPAGEDESFRSDYLSQWHCQACAEDTSLGCQSKSRCEGI